MKFFSRRAAKPPPFDDLSLSIFVGSPSDLPGERALVGRVINEAGVGYGVNSYLWDAERFEHSFSGSTTPQSQIPRASGAFAAVLMFSERIGSAVPRAHVPDAILDFIKDNDLPISSRPGPNQIPLSGSVFELLDVLQSKRNALILLHGRHPLASHLSPDERELGMHRLRQTTRRGRENRALFQRKHDSYYQQIDGLSRLYDELTRKNLWWPVCYQSEDQLERELRGWLAKSLGLSRTYDQDGLSRLTHSGQTLGREDVTRGLAAAGLGDEIFGRRWEALALIQRLRDAESAPRQKPFAFVVGRSGSGKSSFAQSAVANELIRSTQFSSKRTFAPIIVSPTSLSDARSDWPAHAVLATKIAEALGRKALLEELDTHGPNLTAQAIERAFDRHLENDNAQRVTTPVVVVNQFEETLLGSDESFLQKWAPTFEMLSALCAAKRIWVIVTLVGENRLEGFWGRLETFPIVANSRATTGFIEHELAPLGSEQLKAVISRPFTLTGHPHDADWVGTLIPELNSLRVGDNSAPLLPLVALAIEERFDQLDERAKFGLDERDDTSSLSESAPLEELSSFPSPAYADVPGHAKGAISGAMDRLGRRAKQTFLSEGGSDFEGALSRVMRRLTRLEAQASDLEAPFTLVPHGKHSFRNVEARRLVEALEQCRLVETIAQRKARLVHRSILLHWADAKRWSDEERALLEKRNALADWTANSLQGLGRGRPALRLDERMADDAHDLLSSWGDDTTLEKAQVDHLRDCLRVAFSDTTHAAKARERISAAIDAREGELARFYLRKWYDEHAGSIAFDLDEAVDDATTPLIVRAAQSGDIETLATLVELGARLDRRAHDGASALHALSQTPDDGEALAIFASLAFDEARNGQFTIKERKWAPTPRARAILQACRRDDGDQLDRVLHGQSQTNALLNFVDAALDVSQSRALHLACKHGSPTQVAVLLAHGSTPFKWDALGGSPLHAAAERDNASILTMLFHGVGPTAREKRLLHANALGETPAHIAAKAGAIDALRVLLDLGALALDPRDRSQRGPAHSAAKAGQRATLEALLDARPDYVSTPDRFERQPLHLAGGYGRLECVTLLLDRQADPSAADCNGRTPLQLAARFGRVDAAVALLKCARERGDQDDIDKAIVEAITSNHAALTDALLDVLPTETVNRALFGFTPLHIAASSGANAVIPVLLSRGGDPLGRTEALGWTPVHMAASPPFAHIETLRALIDAGGIPLDEHRDRNDQTPLHVAAGPARVDILKYLIERGANLEARTIDGLTPIHRLAKTGRLEALQAIMDPARVNTYADARGEGLLHAAVDGGFPRVVTWLIDMGAQVNARNRFARTPMHIAAYRGHTEVLRFLISVGGDHDAVENSGRTPIDVALREIQHETALLLLEQKPNLNPRRDGGDGALHWSVYVGDARMVERLLEAGALPNARGKNGNTPLHLAVSPDLRRSVDPGFDPRACIDLLLGYGATADIANKYGGTAFDQAADRSDVGLMDLLSNHFAHAWPALHDAVSRGDLQNVVRLLKTQNAVRQRDSGGRTALHHATRLRKTEIISALLAAKADPNARDHRRRTPMHDACRVDQIEVLEPMLRRGGRLNVFDKNDEAPVHSAIINRRRSHVGVACLQFMANSRRWRGALATRRRKSKQSLLHLAANGFNLALVEFLLANGARPLAHDAEGRSAIHMALTAGSSGIFHALLRACAVDPLRLRVAKGRSLLHQAARHARWDIVDFLLEKGADPTLKDREGMTPAQTARERAREDLLRLQENFGRDVQKLEQQAYDRVRMAEYLESLEREWRQSHARSLLRLRQRNSRSD